MASRKNRDARRREELNKKQAARTKRMESPSGNGKYAMRQKRHARGFYGGVQVEEEQPLAPPVQPASRNASERMHDTFRRLVTPGPFDTPERPVVGRWGFGGWD